MAEKNSMEAVRAAMNYLAPNIEAKRLTWPGPTLYYPMRQIGQHGDGCPMNLEDVVANARWHVENSTDAESALRWFQGACVAYYGGARRDFAYSSKQARELALMMVGMANDRLSGVS
jgi:hypothetical protein